MPLENLSTGAFGSEVRDVQDRLRAHGLEIPATETDREFFGPGTRDAVVELQRKFSLKATGTVDVTTRVALQGPAVGVASKPAAPVSSTASNGATAARAVSPSPSTVKAAPKPLQVNRANDFSARDANAKVTFYVPLWKRQGLSLVAFDDYWRDVHGPVCARLPGQFQYWQFHVAHNEGGIFPVVDGVNYTTAEEDHFDGIAELTFRSVADRDIWFTSSSILMDDEHNIFSKAIGYVAEEGNSITYVDGIPTGNPNGDLDIIKYHVMVRQQPGVSNSEFRRYMTDSFAANVIRHKAVLKFRLHLFEPPDVSRPDAAGVVHYEPPEKQYQAAFEIAFRNQLDRETFFASPEYANAVADQARYVKQVSPLPERDAYTFVYEGTMTLAGQRGSRTAELITTLGATNQLRDDIHDLIIGAVSSKSGRSTNGSSSNGSSAHNGGTGNGIKPTMTQIFSPFNRNGAPTPFQPAGKVANPKRENEVKTESRTQKATANGGTKVANNNGSGQQKKRINFYQNLAADYSTPNPVPKHIAAKLISDAERFISLKEKNLPEISPKYSLEQIERENKEWWPSHCEALRQGRGDLLTDEYNENLVYFCQDGPYYGLDEQKEREKHWWALIAQPGVTMTWPVVMFHGEFVWFEWACMDDNTHETIAKGSVAWVRRGHRGGCFFKGEQLTFYRDVYASSSLLKLITT